MSVGARTVASMARSKIATEAGVEALLTERELNRALLARQGLLERLPATVADAPKATGALQMQYWPALGPGLWSRVAECAPGAQFEAHASGELLTGTLLRGTIHTVAAADFPAYHVVTAGSTVPRWRSAKSPPGPGADDLRRELLAHAAEPRTHDELCAFIESWVARNPGVFDDAELEYQRGGRWRPFCTTVGLVRVPLDGKWGAKTPNGYRGVPVESPGRDEALRVVIRRHLAAFGPAAAEDVAGWIGWNLTPVRAALRAMDDLAVFADESGRVLYDLPGAPRPDAETEAPVRLLPWFDSTLLAYHPAHRTRILPDAHKDEIFIRINGRVKASFLVDGMVAGTWTIDDDRRDSTIVLTPLRPLTGASRTALLAEAEAMLRFCRPEARSHRVALADRA